jgi:hypothetical protein
MEVRESGARNDLFAMNNYKTNDFLKATSDAAQDLFTSNNKDTERNQSAKTSDQSVHNDNIYTTHTQQSSKKPGGVNFLEVCLLLVCMDILFRKKIFDFVYMGV